jgi:ubiquinol-cytochrome c reductase cytochrome c subunit
MKRLVVSLALAGLAVAAVAGSALAQGAAPQNDAPKGNAAHGKKIFADYGCWQCHGYQGQGSNAGPKLAPNPLPYDAIYRQLRKPRDRMPVYTRATTSDQDVADIYAYLQTQPKAKTVADIPALTSVQP